MSEPEILDVVNYVYRHQPVSEPRLLELFSESLIFDAIGSDWFDRERKGGVWHFTVKCYRVGKLTEALEAKKQHEQMLEEAAKATRYAKKAYVVAVVACLISVASIVLPFLITPR